MEKPEKYSWEKDVEETSTALKIMYDNNFRVLVHDQGKFVFQLSISFPDIPIPTSRSPPTTMTLEILSTRGDPTPQFKLVGLSQVFGIGQPEIPKLITDIVRRRIPGSLAPQPEKAAIVPVKSIANASEEGEAGEDTSPVAQSYSLSEITQMIVDGVVGEVDSFVSATSEGMNKGLGEKSSANATKPSQHSKSRDSRKGRKATTENNSNTCDGRAGQESVARGSKTAKQPPPFPTKDSNGTKDTKPDEGKANRPKDQLSISEKSRGGKRYSSKDDSADLTDKARFGFLITKSESDICKDIGRDHIDRLERVQKYNRIYRDFVDVCKQMDENGGVQSNALTFVANQNNPGAIQLVGGVDGARCPGEYSCEQEEGTSRALVSGGIAEVNVNDNSERDGPSCGQGDEPGSVKIEELDTTAAATQMSDTTQHSEAAEPSVETNEEQSELKNSQPDTVKPETECTYLSSVNSQQHNTHGLDQSVADNQFLRVSAVFNTSKGLRDLQPIINILTSSPSKSVFTTKISDYFIDKKKQKLKDLLLQYAVYKALGGFDPTGIETKDLEQSFYMNTAAYYKTIKVFKRTKLVSKDVESNIVRVKEKLHKKASKIISSLKTKRASGEECPAHPSANIASGPEDTYTIDISPDTDEDARVILDFLKLPPAPQTTPPLPKYLLKSSNTSPGSGNTNGASSVVVSNGLSFTNGKGSSAGSPGEFPYDGARIQRGGQAQGASDGYDGGYLNINERSESTTNASNLQNFPSRFADEYEVISVLGRGGFGEVLKVRSKIDGNYYALKKVKISNLSTTDDEEEVYGDAMSFTEIQREVLSLSLIKSKNVVRYYTAWIEQNVAVTTLQDSSLLSSEDDKSTYCLGCKADISPVEEERSEDEDSPTLNLDQSGDAEYNTHKDGAGSSLDYYYGSREESSPMRARSVEFNRSRPPLNGTSSRSRKYLDREEDAMCSGGVSGGYKTIDECVADGDAKRGDVCPEGEESYEYVYDDDEEEEDPEEGGPSKTCNVSSYGNRCCRNNGNGSAVAAAAAEGNGDGVESDFVSEGDGEYELSIGDPRLWEDTNDAETQQLDTTSRTDHQLEARKQDKERSSSMNERRIVRPFYTLFILMEICTNGTLRTHLPLITDFMVYKIIIQLLVGLSDIHSKHIIHRDIKPENIFMDDGMNALIGDFGFAYKYSGMNNTVAANSHAKTKGITERITDDSSSTNSFNCQGSSIHSDSRCDPIKKANTAHSPISFLGSGVYMAPEIGQESYNEKVDIYALGIVLFEILYPFRNEDERERVLSDLVSHSDIDNKFPRDWRMTHLFFADLISQMINRDARKRPGASDILKMVLGSKLGFAYMKVEENIRLRERPIDKQKYNEIALGNIGDVVSYLMQSMGLKIRSPPEVYRLRRIGRLVGTDIKNSSTIMNESLLTVPEERMGLSPVKYNKLSKTIRRVGDRYFFEFVSPCSLFVYNIDGKITEKGEASNDSCSLHSSQPKAPQRHSSKHRRCVTSVIERGSEKAPKEEEPERTKVDVIRKEVESIKKEELTPSMRSRVNFEQLNKRNRDESMREFNRFCSPIPYLSIEGRCVVQVHKHFDLALLNLLPENFSPLIASPNPSSLFQPPVMLNTQTRRTLAGCQGRVMMESEDKVSFILANRPASETEQFIQIFRCAMVSIVERHLLRQSKEKKEVFNSSLLIVGKNSITSEFLQRVGMFSKNKLVAVDREKIAKFRDHHMNVPSMLPGYLGKKVPDMRISGQSVGVYNQREFKAMLQHEKIRIDNLFDFEETVRLGPKTIGGSDMKTAYAYVSANLPFLDNIVYSFVPVHDDNNTVVSLYYRYMNLSSHSTIGPSSTNRFPSYGDYWFQLLDKTGNVLVDFNSVSVDEMKLSVLQFSLNSLLNIIPIRVGRPIYITSSFTNETIYNFVVRALWETLVNNGIKVRMLSHSEAMHEIECANFSGFTNGIKPKWYDDARSNPEVKRDRVIIHKVYVFDADAHVKQSLKYSSAKLNRGIMTVSADTKERVGDRDGAKTWRQQREQHKTKQQRHDNSIELRNDIGGGAASIDAVVCEYMGTRFNQIRDLIEALKRNEAKNK